MITGVNLHGLANEHIEVIRLACDCIYCTSCSDYNYNNNYYYYQYQYQDRDEQMNIQREALWDSGGHLPLCL